MSIAISFERDRETRNKMADEEAPLTASDPPPRRRFQLKFYGGLVFLALVAIILQAFAAGRPRRGWLKMGWQAATALGAT